MAYQRKWIRTVPVKPGDDEDLLVWLMRESAEKYAAGYLLKVIEFTDLGEVDVRDINPVAVKQLGEEYRGCRFRKFLVVAEREPVDA